MKGNGLSTSTKDNDAYIQIRKLLYLFKKLTSVFTKDQNT